MRSRLALGGLPTIFARPLNHSSNDRAGSRDPSVSSAGGKLPLLLSALGALWAALCLLDPALTLAAPVGPALAGSGLWRARGAGGLATGQRLLLTLACVYALIAWTGPTFGGDSPSYYVYLRSLAFDRDLDFANEWRTWGYKQTSLTPTGHRANVHAIGAACLWSPFFLLAHAYVLANWLGGRISYAADGFSDPYVRSAALGTATLAVGGAFLLIKELSRRLGTRLSALGVAGATLASPVPYYLFVQPAMAHGLVFALACAFVAVWMRSAEEPSRESWVVLGTLLGLLALTRWQAGIYVFMFLPLLLDGMVTRRVRWSWPVQAAGAALLAFTPQLVAWKVLFGTALAAPHAQHGMDWRSPHFVDVMISADRGLFSWTPLMALGLVGLLVLLRRWPGFVTASLAVFVGSVWINGGVKDWAGADAFGGRRFDLMVPLLAVGVTVLARAMTEVVARRPWVAAATVLALAALWNVGLMRLYRIRAFHEAAPLERVAARQVHQVRHALEALLLRLGGPSLRNLAYNFFVGEYLYWNVNLDGAIHVGAVENRFLGDGWSPPRRRAGWPQFRWGFHPRACVSLPLQGPVLLRSFIRARAPQGLEAQAMTIVVNGRPIATRTVPGEWTDIPFEIPESALSPGPNSLCFDFAEGVGEDEDRKAAAAVALIQLP